MRRTVNFNHQDRERDVERERESKRYNNREKFKNPEDLLRDWKRQTEGGKRENDLGKRSEIRRHQWPV